MEGQRPYAEHFKAPGGALMEFARRTHQEVIEGLYYLARVRLAGPAQAGAETCKRFGHGTHARGGRCERCGALGPGG